MSCSQAFFLKIVDPPANRKPPRYGDGGDSRDGDDAESRNPVDFGDIEIGTLDSFLRLGPDAVVMINSFAFELEGYVVAYYRPLF